MKLTTCLTAVIAATTAQAYQVRIGWKTIVVGTTLGGMERCIPVIGLLDGGGNYVGERQFKDKENTCDSNRMFYGSKQLLQEKLEADNLDLEDLSI
ncbi:hypothetical protein QBC44DRAFT_372754 [Cladorrhinum sp. PSN332]|nr:hypothetical protein QBC44DRAFT_372754 [Cladorrhinum sp. PSN332]